MYDIFYIGSKSQYFESLKKKFPFMKLSDSVMSAQKMCLTTMFWVVYEDLILDDDFYFDVKIPKWDEKYIHVFRNGDYYDGVCLIPKREELSVREIKHRFFTNKKEIDQVVSYPKKFDKFYLKTFQEYLDACEQSTTDMFWAIWDDISVTDFDFNYYVPFYDTFHRNITHVFKNGNYYDGICLFSKKETVTKKEFEHRFFTNKKEVDIIASYPKTFEVWNINSYEDYQHALNESQTNMFYAVWDDIHLLDFKFDYQVPRYNQNIVHVFKNGDHFDGICLFPKHNLYAKREIEKRFFQTKKEVDIRASNPKNFDIVFISYQEPNAEENFATLKSKYPTAKRIHGVKGIHAAHKKAAELSSTQMFWVVDGDAQIVDDFAFKYDVAIWDQDTVHVWRSRNPINNLEYGYGGVKLLPRDLTLKLDISTVDMTTSISDKFKLVDAVSNLTAFNTDEFSTWKSAFRECVKLSSKIIKGQVDSETEDRLNIWCSQGIDKLYGKYAINGALAGRKFAEENPQDLFKVNDFEWLYQHFLDEKNRDH